MDFTEMLKTMMENRGYTAYRLAKEVPCSQTSVANWLKGQIPTPAMQRRVLEVFRKDEDLRAKEKTVTQTDDGQRDRDLFIQLYNRASPEMRAAVLLILKAAESNHDIPGDDPKD